MTNTIKTKVSDVTSFLTKTGFILEMEIAEFLKERGYQTKVNQYFLDLDEDKKREIDIVATKVINKVLINLIIECKQSIYDDWIFLCSDKDSPRYYYAVKHLPKVVNLKKSKIFNSFHIFDYKIPLAQNYLVFQKSKGKKSDAQQIEECLFKLPKALFYIASKANQNIKNIFFPIGLFNRSIFIASYDKKLIVKKQKFVQYFIDCESENYTDKKEVQSLIKKQELETSSYDLRERIKQNEKNAIIKTAELLGHKFQIDFVVQQGFGKYLDKVEKDANSVSVKKWSFNTKSLSSRPRHPLI